jgi:hypothetical protein
MRRHSRAGDEPVKKRRRKQADPEFEFQEGAKFGGLHTMLGVPLLL